MSGVLIIAERALPDRGGLAVATSRIARLAHARGEKVHIVRPSSDVEPGARGRRTSDGVVDHPVGRLPSEDESAMALLAHARDVLEENALDLVHGIYATRAGYLATILAREAQVGSIVSLRGNDLDRGLLRARDLPFLEHAVRCADVVTGVSNALCRTAAAVFERPVDYVPNSVDATAFAPASPDPGLRRELGLAEGAVIGFSGELREKKGIRFLLPAFADVLRRRPASLLLVGGVRSEAKDALEAFRQIAPEAAARLHLVPYDRDPARLSRLFALCDVMVFPSLFEGQPNAVLEAMACARPVLATAVGGHLDLIAHGKTGALLPLSELSQLPRAIEEVLDLPSERRETFGKGARERVIGEHGSVSESTSWSALYCRARTLTQRRRRYH